MVKIQMEMEKSESKKSNVVIPKSTKLEDSSFNQNVLDAQKEYEEKLSKRPLARVESGGINNSNTYIRYLKQ